MTQEELDGLLHSLAQQLRELGIPVSRELAPRAVVNTRAKRRLGCCVRREGAFEIQVAARLLEDAPRLRETLIHELLHTCPGCMDHGPRWKAYAARAGEALGATIQRVAAVEGPSQPLRREEVKYLLRCQSCGRLIPRLRMSKAVRRPGLYRCPCGGRLERLL